MRNPGWFAVVFTAIVICFFLPAIPYIAEAMLGLHYLSIALYWILLTITSITVGVKAIKGDDK